jgi:hypothetical protein
VSEKISAADSIVGVMRAVSAVGKTGRNTVQNFNFRGIDGVLNAVGPALREVGGFIVPKLVDSFYEHGSTAKGAATVEVKLTVEYRWFGTDGGEPIKSVVIAEAMDMSDKATAKAWSVAYRTYLLQILCLPTDEPDPDSEYIERGAQVGASRANTATASKGTRGAPAPVSAAISTPAKASRDWAGLGAACKSMDELRVLYSAATELGELEVPLGDGGTVHDFLWALRGELAKEEQK